MNSFETCFHCMNRKINQLFCFFIDIGKPNDCIKKISSQSAVKDQSGQRKWISKFLKANSTGKQSTTNIPRPVLPFENDQIWESRNLRSWDNYHLSFMYPNHHYKLVTMDEVKNLFNPNRKPVIVEEHIPLESNGVKICPSSKSDLMRSGYLFEPDCLIKDQFLLMFQKPFAKTIQL